MATVERGPCWYRLCTRDPLRTGAAPRAKDHTSHDRLCRARPLARHEGFDPPDPRAQLSCSERRAPRPRRGSRTRLARNRAGPARAALKLSARWKPRSGSSRASEASFRDAIWISAPMRPAGPQCLAASGLRGAAGPPHRKIQSGAPAARTMSMSSRSGKLARIGVRSGCPVVAFS